MPPHPTPLPRSLDGAPATWVARWGLVPGWAKDPSNGHKLAMARGETAHEKPSFREAIKRRRALMPADLFYEWQPVEGQKGTMPWCVRKRDEQPFFMGALWEQWTPHDNRAAAPLLTCCVITTDANDALRPIQDRMPLLIDEADIEHWLKPSTSPDDIQAFMQPRAVDDLYSYRVSNWVNRPLHDDPRCAKPLEHFDAHELLAGDATRANARTPNKEKRTDQLDAFQ